MTVGSDSSSRLIFEKLVQKDIHGMLPSVSNYTVTSLAQLDPSAKKDVPPGGGEFVYTDSNITSSRNQTRLLLSNSGNVLCVICTKPTGKT